MTGSLCQQRTNLTDLLSSTHSVRTQLKQHLQIELALDSEFSEIKRDKKLKNKKTGGKAVILYPMWLAQNHLVER